MLISNKISLEKKYEIKNIIFNLAWCLLLTQVLIFNSTLPSPPFKVTALCLILLAFSAIFPFDYKINEIVIIALSGVITVLILYNSKSADILWIYLFIICSKGIKLKPLFKKTLYIYSCFFILCIILSNFGFITNVSDTHPRTSKLKYALGFVTANTAHGIYLIIILLLLTTYYNKLNMGILVALLLENFYLYSHTLCRTSAIIIFILILSVIFEKLFNKYISQKYYNLICLLLVISSLLFILIFTISSILVNRTNIPFIEKYINLLSSFVTNRIVFSSYYIKDYGIHIFGTIIKLLSAPYLDIGYIFLLVNFGVIFYFVYIIGYIYLLFRNYKNANFSKLIVLFGVLLYMTNEHIFALIFFNFTYLYFRDFIFINNKNLSE